MTEIKCTSEMGVEFIDKMGSDETVARAARVSTGKDQLSQGKIDGLIEYLVREGHTSTLEHCTVTVRVHVPLFVRTQILTHRTLAKNSESARYKELEPLFYVPSEDRPLYNSGSGAHPNLVPGEDEAHEKVLEQGVTAASMQVISYCWGYYSDLLKIGVATEVARNVLPVSIYTSMYLTGNLLGWFNFLSRRNGSDGHPQYEIVEVAQRVERIIEEHFPVTYKAWKKHNQ